MITVYANHNGKKTQIPDQCGVLSSGKWHYIEWDATDKKLYAYEVENNVIKASTMEELTANATFTVEEPIKVDTTAWKWEKINTTKSEVANVGTKSVVQKTSPTTSGNTNATPSKFEQKKAEMRARLASNSKSTTKIPDKFKNVDISSPDFNVDDAIDDMSDNIAAMLLDQEAIPAKKTVTTPVTKPVITAPKQDEVSTPDDLTKAIELVRKNGIHVGNNDNPHSNNQQPQIITNFNTQPIQQPQLQPQVAQPILPQYQQVQLPVLQMANPQAPYNPYGYQPTQLIQVPNPQVQAQPVQQPVVVSQSGTFSNLQAIQQIDEKFIFENAHLILLLQSLPPEKRQSIFKLISAILTGNTQNLSIALL